MNELETKHLLAPGRKPDKALRRLLQDLVWAGFQVHPQGTRLVHDVYFDTADERMRRAGWSLRCRHRSLALELTCKQLGGNTSGWFERREIEQTTLHETPAFETLEEGPVLDLLRRYVPASTELVPTFTQDNRRASYRLTHPDYPRSVIELVMDRVAVAGEPAFRYVEFEGELKQGPTTLLSEFNSVMTAQPDLIRSRTSKFERGLFSVDPDLTTGDRKRDLMTPDDAWAALGANFLHEQHQALVGYEPFAYEGLHVEGVHQMRVASRRLRAALKAFGDVLPAESSKTLTAEAGWLCDVLGHVRDLDVHLEALNAYRTQLPRGRLDSLARYEQHLRTARRRARRCLIESLESPRYAEFLRHFLQLLQQAETLSHESGPSIRSFAKGHIPERLRRIRKAGRRIDRKSEPEAYHRLRIRIKKLRYQLEILNGPYGKELKKTANALRRLQGRLGDHQDACVAEAELKLFRDTQAVGGRERRTFDWLMKLEASRAAALRSRFNRDWRRFELDSRDLGRKF